MNLEIIPGRATEDVKEIESIVDRIDVAMQELNEVINRLIPERLETQWSVELKENWTKCYNNSVQNAMDGMRASATNLQNAVNAALEYSKQ
jgi:hypothetical protein